LESLADSDQTTAYCIPFYVPLFLINNERLKKTLSFTYIKIPFVVFFVKILNR